MKQKTRLCIIVFFLTTLLVQVQTVFACSMAANVSPGEHCGGEPKQEPTTKHPQKHPQSTTAPAHTLSKMCDNQSCCNAITSLAVKSSAANDHDPGNDHAITAEYFKLSLPLLALSLSTIIVDYHNVSLVAQQKNPALTIVSTPTYKTTERYRI